VLEVLASEDYTDFKNFINISVVHSNSGLYLYCHFSSVIDKECNLDYLKIIAIAIKLVHYFIIIKTTRCNNFINLFWT